MNEQLATVVGMSIAYIASFVGLGLAWWSWRRRVDDGQDPAGGTDDPSPDTRGGTRSREGGSGPQREDAP